MKEREKSGRKECPSLEPGVTDAGSCLSLWTGGIVSTGLNSAIVCNRVIQKYSWKQPQHAPPFYTFNEIKLCHNPKVRLFN